MNYNQNGGCLLVCSCRHYLSHLLPNCFQITYMDYFYQTLTQVLIWTLRITKMAAELAPTFGDAHLSPDFFQISYRTALAFVR